MRAMDVKNLTVIMMIVFLMTACSATNPVVNGKNTMGLAGAGGGAVGGAMLGKKFGLTGTPLLGAVALGTVVGGVSGYAMGSYADKKDGENQKEFIEGVLTEKENQANREKVKQMEQQGPYRNNGSGSNGIVINNNIAGGRVNPMSYDPDSNEPKVHKQKTKCSNFKFRVDYFENNNNQYDNVTGRTCLDQSGRWVVHKTISH